MSTRDEVTRAYGEGFDAERRYLYPEGSSLTLVLNAGTGDESELEITGGWISERQQRFGEVASIRLVKVTERPELTAEAMSQADRLRLNGVLYQFNYDPPVEDVWWTFYATELKAGGMR